MLLSLAYYGMQLKLVLFRTHTQKTDKTQQCTQYISIHYMNMSQEMIYKINIMSSHTTSPLFRPVDLGA